MPVRRKPTAEERERNLAIMSVPVRKETAYWHYLCEALRGRRTPDPEPYIPGHEWKV